MTQFVQEFSALRVVKDPPHIDRLDCHWSIGVACADLRIEFVIQVGIGVRYNLRSGVTAHLHGLDRFHLQSLEVKQVQVVTEGSEVKEVIKDLL